jgi:hypothetical protein
MPTPAGNGLPDGGALEQPVQVSGPRRIALARGQTDAAAPRCLDIAWPALMPLGHRVRA